MNQIEFDFMKGMISILNEVADVHRDTGKKIITDEQYNVRLEDLKQLEGETSIVFANSPTVKECYDVIAKANYFVCNEESNPIEYQKAKEFGIKIISVEELIEMLNK